MKTIYISGKIDGCGQWEVECKFAKAYRPLRDMFGIWGDNGFMMPHTVNPTTIGNIPNGTWFDYMMRDLVYLKHCDTIYMLRDWKDSAGARIEHEFAKKLGLEIIYEEE